MQAALDALPGVFRVCTVGRRGTPGSRRILFTIEERTAQVTRQEERIRELVELIALANGSNEVLLLAEELKVLVDARKKRLRSNPPDGLTESHSGGDFSSSFRRRLGELP
jgi:hypothetical protein